MRTLPLMGLLAALSLAASNCPAEKKPADNKPAENPRDCIRNNYGQPLIVHVTSGRGHWRAELKDGESKTFPFVNDGQERILSAFTPDNRLAVYYSFHPQPADAQGACLVLQKQPKREAADKKPAKDGKGKKPHGKKPRGKKPQDQKPPAKGQGNKFSAAMSGAPLAID